jgi:heme exporter protein C
VRSNPLTEDVDAEVPDVPDHTGSPATRVLGIAALAAVVLAVLYGLVWSPADVEMGDSTRLMYVHVPSAVLSYLGCAITTGASIMWLRRRTPGWDALAVAGAEIGLVFVALCLLSGMLWGRPTWGTFWVWDARLTSTALLEVMLLGYLLLRWAENAAFSGGSKRAAVLGLLLFPNVILVNRSVEWWRTQHQTATTLKLDPSIEGDMFVALIVGFVAAALVFAWLLVHRFRVAWLQHRFEARDFEAALAARRAEASRGRSTGLGDAVGPAAPAPSQAEVTA